MVALLLSCSCLDLSNLSTFILAGVSAEPMMYLLNAWGTQIFGDMLKSIDCYHECCTTLCAHSASA